MNQTVWGGMPKRGTFGRAGEGDVIVCGTYRSAASTWPSFSMLEQGQRRSLASCAMAMARFAAFDGCRRSSVVERTLAEAPMADDHVEPPHPAMQQPLQGPRPVGQLDQDLAGFAGFAIGFPVRCGFRFGRRFRARRFSAGASRPAHLSLITGSPRFPPGHSPSPCGRP
jgi:hypothetical protein